MAAFPKPTMGIRPSTQAHQESRSIYGETILIMISGCQTIVTLRKIVILNSLSVTFQLIIALKLTLRIF